MSGKIKLGIDAKWYYSGPPSGRVVVKNLVDEIVKKETDRFDIYLFIDKKFKHQANLDFPGYVKLIFLKANPNLLSNLLIIPFLSRKHRLDIILFQNFSSFWPDKFKKVVYIHDVLFLDFPQYYSKAELLYFKPMGLLAKKADHIITISSSEKDRLAKYRIADEESISIVHHGISGKFKPISEYSTLEIDRFNSIYNLPEKYLLFVGRLNIRKNLLNLVRSLEYLTDNEIGLVVVGKADHKNFDLKAYIENVGLKNRIVFTGHVPDNDLYLIFAKATVFCFPSFAEGFGLPPLEAMKCGVPAVVTNRTSMPEICGPAGIYINAYSPKDIAEKIQYLLDNEDYRTQKKEQSINHAALFSWEKSAKQILTILESVSQK